MARQPMIFKNSLTNYRIGRENKRLFLNNEEIIGAQNVQIDITSPFAPVPHLGMNSASTVLRGNPNGTVIIQSLLVNKDCFVGFTGSVPCTGFLLDSSLTEFFDARGRSHISFSPTYMTNYSCRYNDGNIPEITANFTAFESLGMLNWDDITTFINSTGITDSDPSYTLKIPSRSSINLTLDTYNTNRVENFEISIQTNRNPKFRMGYFKPYEVLTVPPINISCSFGFLVGEYEQKNLESLWWNKYTKSLSLTINDHITSELISSYSFSNLDVTAYGLGFNTANDAVLTLQLQGCINL